MLKQARLTAYKASCQNNLHQLMIGVHLYADTWNGCLPPVDSPSGGPTQNPQNEPRSLYGLLRPYVKSSGIFKCDAAPWAWPWDPANNLYGILNYQYHWNATYPPVKKMDAMTRPTRNVLIMDMWEWACNWGGIHQGGDNYAYVDGHIRWVSVKEYGPQASAPPFSYP
jgi:prepilin-type processing-associated H-X9-DG protein